MTARADTHLTACKRAQCKCGATSEFAAFESVRKIWGMRPVDRTKSHSEDGLLRCPVSRCNTLRVTYSLIPFQFPLLIHSCASQRRFRVTAQTTHSPNPDERVLAPPVDRHGICSPDAAAVTPHLCCRTRAHVAAPPRRARGARDACVEPVFDKGMRGHRTRLLDTTSRT
eukprot:IDg16447t1